MGRGNSVLNQDGCAPINLDFDSSLDAQGLMHDANHPEDPIIALVLSHCPPPIRSAWRWLFTFEKKINDGVARVGEPVLGQMRIAWWRDRILDTSTLPVQRDPLLLELAELANGQPELPQMAGKLLDTIEARLTAEEAEHWADAVACSGASLANAFTQMMGQPADGNVGRAFGCARLLAARNGLSSEQEQALIDCTRMGLAAARANGLPRSLSLMRLYASQILSGPPGERQKRDGLKLVIHSLTGWPKY